MAVRELGPAEAHEALMRDPQAVYLDVRTEAEFAAGHPVGARNVPVAVLDPQTGRPRLNVEFVAVVARHVAPGTPLIVGCQSGVRSMRACDLLEAAGFTNLVNVRGGFGGAHDHTGRLVEPGWEAAGLPVERGQPAGRSFADLAGKG
ncbi:MAG TPA: rhodanese-like domain-containing protein [Candidatus Binatia bacterium]|nr:rhodanese-like domain-containing protein [Candidatus Binatia bacterium]